MRQINFSEWLNGFKFQYTQHIAIFFIKIIFLHNKYECELRVNKIEKTSIHFECCLTLPAFKMISLQKNIGKY